jgi:solute:Na+ symporter, SSS family
VTSILPVFSDLEGKLLPPAWAQRDAIIPALLASLFCMVAVSLLTPAPRREQWAPFFGEESAEAATK